MSMVTIKDVAKKANVSIGTASRALHNNGYVSKASFEAVKNAARELGYVVNINALQLKNRKSNNVGILISDINNPYFIHVLNDLNNRLKERNISLITAFGNGTLEEAKQIKYLIGNKVSTILFVPSNDKNIDVLNIAKANDINIIQLFVNIYPGFNSIVNDDETGVYISANKLINDGCKRIVLLDVLFNENEFSVTVKPNRTEGIEQIQKERSDIEFKVIKINPATDFEKQIQDDFNDFAPDGVVAGTGVFGFEILKYCKANSLKIKIVSFDDDKWFAFQGISTIRQNEKKLIDEIVRLILSNDKNNIEHIKISEKIINRN